MTIQSAPLGGADTPAAVEGGARPLAVADLPRSPRSARAVEITCYAPPAQGPDAKSAQHPRLHEEHASHHGGSIRAANDPPASRSPATTVRPRVMIQALTGLAFAGLCHCPAGRAAAFTSDAPRVQGSALRPADETSDAEQERALAAADEQGGRRLLEQGDSSGALLRYQAALHRMQQLTAADPTNTTWQTAVGDDQGAIGDILLGLGRSEDALVSYQAALEVWQKLTGISPASVVWQEKLADTDEQIGVVQASQGRLDQALTSYLVEERVRKRLCDARPSLLQLREYLADTNRRIGDTLTALGQPEGARALQRSAHARGEAPDGNAPRQPVAWLDRQRASPDRRALRGSGSSRSGRQGLRGGAARHGPARRRQPSADRRAERPGSAGKQGG